MSADVKMEKVEGSEVKLPVEGAAKERTAFRDYFLRLNRGTELAGVVEAVYGALQVYPNPSDEEYIALYLFTAYGTHKKNIDGYLSDYNVFQVAFPRIKANFDVIYNLLTHGIRHAQSPYTYTDAHPLIMELVLYSSHVAAVDKVLTSNPSLKDLQAQGEKLLLTFYSNAHFRSLHNALVEVFASQVKAEEEAVNQRLARQLSQQNARDVWKDEVIDQRISKLRASREPCAQEVDDLRLARQLSQRSAWEDDVPSAGSATQRGDGKSHAVKTDAKDHVMRERRARENRWLRDVSAKAPEPDYRQQLLQGHTDPPQHHARKLTPPLGLQEATETSKGDSASKEDPVTADFGSETKRMTQKDAEAYLAKLGVLRAADLTARCSDCGSKNTYGMAIPPPSPDEATTTKVICFDCVEEAKRQRQAGLPITAAPHVEMTLTQRREYVLSLHQNGIIDQDELDSTLRDLYKLSLTSLKPVPRRQDNPTPKEAGIAASYYKVLASCRGEPCARAKEEGSAAKEPAKPDDKLPLPEES
ncbi:Hypothetical protein POVN_LOCUS535 [uncultured virus]|nr:Hypothetical protein POVN_LOCUS535 [uncultured virus]